MQCVRCQQLSRAYSTATKPRVIFSGIQPTGIPHIGNHLGALKQWQKLVQQADARPPDQRDRLFFSVVGLHALTVPQDPSVLLKERREMFAVLLALGLDKHAVLFHQDDVPEHAELAWYLNCITSVGRLMRMTTWKSKLATLRNANSEDEVDESMLQLGLFAYPVLQAADVLLYKTTHVPVGHDQSQHLELARDLAQAFNRQYPLRVEESADTRTGKSKRRKCNVFRVPDVMLTEHPRIQSLRNPTQKMSKSAPNASSKILMTDTTGEIEAKIKSAVTDSINGVMYEPEARPGVSGLLQIYSGYTDEKVEEIARRYPGERGIRDMKSDLVGIIDGALKPFRDELSRIRDDEGYIRAKEAEGASRAREVAQRTVHEVRAAVGTASY